MGVNEWYDAGETRDINGLPVFFRRSGEGETLVCIHGLPSSSWDYAPVWRAFSSRFDVVAHDLIGLGRSAKPKQPLTIRLQADILEGLLSSLGITSAHIIAHDLGDTVAQELLARQMNEESKILWRSCIFLNGGLFPETHRPLFIQKLLLSPLGPFVTGFITERSLYKNFHRIFSPAHPPEDEFIHETWMLITSNNGKSMIPGLMKYMVEREEFRERWVSPLIRKIVPVRLINGVQDPISGRHAADRYAELVEDADIVYLENCGHYPHVETPDAVVKAVMEFHGW